MDIHMKASGFRFGFCIKSNWLGYFDWKNLLLLVNRKSLPHPAHSQLPLIFASTHSIDVRSEAMEKSFSPDQTKLKYVTDDSVWQFLAPL